MPHIISQVLQSIQPMLYMLGSYSTIFQIVPHEAQDSKPKIDSRHQPPPVQVAPAIPDPQEISGHYLPHTQPGLY